VWVNNHIGDFATTSLTMTVQPEGGFGDMEFFVNIQNLFDAEPPVGGYSGNGTRAGLRDGFALGDDVVGRYFTAGFRVKF
jgi:outer membrane receptor protein involved in Fe transport